MSRLAGLLALLALVLAGCGGTTGAGTGGAEVVPGDAIMYIAIDADPDSSQWQAVDALASRFPDKAKGVNTIKQALRDEGFDWEKDVKPALGPEFDFVWLDLENDGENFVVLTRPDDKAKFDKLVKRIQETSPDLFRGRVDDWEILGPAPEVIDRFREASESSDSKLSDNDAFNEAMSSYPDESLVRLYLSGKKIMGMIRKELEPDELKYVDKLGRLDWVASDLRATPEGLRLDMNLHGKAGPGLKGVLKTGPVASTLTHEVPKNALLYAAFHGAKGMLTGLEDNPLFKDEPELRRYSGLLRRVESLLQGENAVYVRPAPGKIPEITIVTEPKPGTNGMTTLDGILSRYRSQLELPSRPKPSRVAGVPARTVDTGPFTVYYANVGKHLVVTDKPAGIKALKGNPPSLAQSQEYKGALDSANVPPKTQAFFYVNLRGGISYAERLSKTSFPGDVKRNLRPLRSAVEYALTRPSEIQVTFFLRIK